MHFFHRLLLSHLEQPFAYMQATFSSPSQKYTVSTLIYT